MTNLQRLGALCILAGGVILSACDKHEEEHMHMMDYSLSVTNLSANQPLTPPAFILHGAGYKPWALGTAASAALEKLAEGGDGTDLISTAGMDMAVAATTSGSAIIGPGASASFTLSTEHHDGLQISMASMLANTNDAFTGVANLDISSLQQGQSTSVMLKVMDAGTEANTEAAGSIPGPADTGGTGYDMARDDLMDKVRIHAGVVSMDDGLSTSILDETHRWNGPVAKLTITRL